MTSFKIPFGKYKGETIENIYHLNINYLHWLYEQDWVKRRYPSIYNEIEQLITESPKKKYTRSKDNPLKKEVNMLKEENGRLKKENDMLKSLIKATEGLKDYINISDKAKRKIIDRIVAGLEIAGFSKSEAIQMIKRITH